MQLRQIDLESRQDVHKFIIFPFKLYQGCNQWVPPLIANEKKKLNPAEHPFYQHSTCEFYVAEDQRGKVLGRIALQHNTRHNEQLGLNAGIISFFEVVDDQAAANLLFEKAEAWARAKGFNTLEGPKGLLNTESGGVLIEGFEHSPAMNVPYNYDYYQKFYEDFGFTKKRDSLSGYIDVTKVEVPDRVRRIAEKVMEKRGYWIKRFETKDEMRAMVDQAQTVLNESFRDGVSFVEMTDAEFAMAADELISIADPKLIKVVMKGDKIIGYLFAYHDLREGLKRARGRFFPFGWWHLMQAQKNTDWVNVNGVGVLPEYQGRGANAVMYVALGDTIKGEYGQFRHADTVFIGEENHKSFSDNITMGVTWYKRHRMYEKTLD
ncbi:MAG: hypothetical protein JW757_04125 [Anaerolineales bacterium]|nr:hypothetical protein [Anaerolineales bacterium]